MKEFLEKHSYTAVNLFLNQLVIGIFFGVGLLFVANKIGSEAVKIGISVFSIIFYLFLEYTVAYKVGVQDRVSVELGKAKADLGLPVKLWLLSNSINLLLALFIMLGHLFSNVSFFSSAGGIGAMVAMIIEGMYIGVLSINVGGAALNEYWIMWFAITLPALAVIFLSYLAGVKSRKVAKMFEFEYPESDRPEKKSKKKKG